MYVVVMRSPVWQGHCCLEPTASYILPTGNQPIYHAISNEFWKKFLPGRVLTDWWMEIIGNCITYLLSLSSLSLSREVNYYRTNISEYENASIIYWTYLLVICIKTKWALKSLISKLIHPKSLLVAKSSIFVFDKSAY